MKTIKSLTLLILLCLWGGQVRAQAWARMYNISKAIPGTSWTDIAKIIKTSDDKYVVAGTITGTNYVTAVIAKFSSAGMPVWVQELRGAPESIVTVTDIAESNDASNPGFAISGYYNFTLPGPPPSMTPAHNYLARLDGNGNYMWDRSWIATAWGDERLVAVIFAKNASNDIVTVGTAYNAAPQAYNTTVYRFNNTGTVLLQKMISLDQEIMPVDVLEDPNFQNGGFFILGNYSTVAYSFQTKPYCLFVDNSFNVVQGQFLQYTGAAYQDAEAIQFEQDLPSGNLYILANVRGANGAGRADRPSIIRFNPSTFALACVVQAPGIIGSSQDFPGTDLCIIDGDVSNGIMVTANYFPASGGVRSFTWKISSGLVTQSFYEDQLYNANNARNSSLTHTPDNQYYILAGFDNTLNLVLNKVDLTGSKVDASGAVICGSPVKWFDENPTVRPFNIYAGTSNLSIQPISESSTQDFSWWYDAACQCLGVSPSTTYHRNALLGAKYDTWGLEINRASYDAANRRMYLNNSDMSEGVPQVIQVNASGNSPWTLEYHNVLPGPYGAVDEEGRQTITYAVPGSAGNPDLITATRLIQQAGAPKLVISRRTSGGGAVWPGEVYFPFAPSPGRVYMTLDAQQKHVIVVADMDGPNAGSVTRALFISRINLANGAVVYAKVMPVTYNSIARDNFKVLGLEATQDNGFIICGSSGENGDFIAGHVMKFDGAGPPFTGTLDWQYVFRRQVNIIPCYQLGNLSCQSASMFYAVRQDGANGYYVVGYTSDHDASSQGASFWNGLVVKLDMSGAEVSVREYINSGTEFTTFKGLVLTDDDLAIVGDMHDRNTGTRTDLFARIDKATLNVQDSYTYGPYDNSTLLDIFETDPGSGNGFTMAGSTEDAYGVPALLIMRTDGNGLNGCEDALVLNPATPVNDPISLTLDPAIDFFKDIANYEMSLTCTDVYEVCSPLAGAPQALKIDNSSAPEKDEPDFKAYPNPTTGQLNLTLKLAKAANLTLRMYDMQGREVLAQDAAVNEGEVQLQMNIAELKTGLYLLKISDTEGHMYPAMKIQKQ